MTKRPLRKLSSWPEDAPLPSYLHPEDPTIIYHHLDGELELPEKNPSKSWIKILMIRDPRDTLLSMRTWIEVMADTPAALQFIQLPQEEQIHQLILAPDLSMNGRYPFVFDLALACELAAAWMQDPLVLVVRFEDLVGPLGGGSKERQIHTLQKLAEHLGLSLEDHEIEEIANDLFGDTVTFHKGQIGAWRSQLTPKQKDLFKSVMGKDLIELGYEQNYQW